VEEDLWWKEFVEMCEFIVVISKKRDNSIV